MGTVTLPLEGIRCLSLKVELWYRFKSDSRDDIALCEMCYLVHAADVLKVAYKCSRLVSPGFWDGPGSDTVWKAKHLHVTCKMCGACPIKGRR